MPRSLRRPRNIIFIVIAFAAINQPQAHAMNGPDMVFRPLDNPAIWIDKAPDLADVGLDAYRETPGEINLVVRYEDHSVAHDRFHWDGGEYDVVHPQMPTGLEASACARQNLLVAEITPIVEPVEGYREWGPITEEIHVLCRPASGAGDLALLAAIKRSQTNKLLAAILDRKS